MTKQMQQQRRTQQDDRRQTWRARSIALAVIAGIGLSACATSSAFAQAARKPTTPAAAPTPGIVAATPGGKGLNGLNPQEVLGELSGRGLTTLRDKAFEVYKVPETDRKGFVALQALRNLTDKKKNLSPGQRQRELVNAVNGLNLILPSLKNPSQLMEYAALLVTEGATREVNLMEYWGETTAGQSRLRPVALAIDNLFERAVTAALAEKSAIEKKMNNPNNEVLAKQWEAVDELESLAIYNRGMARYYMALSMTLPAMKEERDKAAEAGITVLKEHDNDQSGIQAVVKNRIAKLYMTKSEPDVAKQFFTAVANGETMPPGDSNMVYDAKYFSAVCDLMRGDVTGAKKQLAALEQWQTENIKDENTLKGVQAAAEMLRYRIFSAEAKMSPAGPAKTAAENNAINVLMALNKARPELRTIIFSQLIERIGKETPVATMDPLLLEAMVQKAREDLELPLDDKLKTTLARGVEATLEMQKRAAEKKPIPPALVESATFLIPHFLEKMGDKLAAGNAFIDAMQKYPKNPDVPTAFQNAGRLIVADLHNQKVNPTEWNSAPVVKAYERFLPIAIKPPYNMTALAYEYAELLRKGEGKRYKEAAEYYAMVPSTDPRYLAAQYQRMIAITNLIDEVGKDKKPVIPAGAARTAMVTDVVTTAQRVRGLALAASQAATDPLKKQREQIRAAGCTLTAAQMTAGELKDFKKTLEIVQSFEQEAAGIPEGVLNPMLASVLQLRVGCYMDLGDFKSATDTLLKLLNAEGAGDKGQMFVLALLQKLDDDFKKAGAAGDTVRVKSLANSRAQLAGFLVDWAKKSPNPEINKRVYSYSVFAAEAQLSDAEMNNDAASLKAAYDSFKNLLGPDMSKLYQKEIAGNPKADKEFPHPNALLGLGKAAFAQKEYAEAEAAFGRLLNAKKLGTAKIMKIDPRNPAEVIYVDNEAYWEAWYKFLKVKFITYDANKSDAKAISGYEDAKGALKRLYIVSNPPGGEKWSSSFEAMRRDYIPDFDPKTIVAQTQPAASQPATAPAEGAAPATPATETPATPAVPATEPPAVTPPPAGAAPAEPAK